MKLLVVTNNKMKYDVNITHSIAHYNPGLNAHVPEYWTADLKVTDEIRDFFNVRDSFEFDHNCFYGTSRLSEKEAINNLIRQLKGYGFSGILKIHRR